MKDNNSKPQANDAPQLNNDLQLNAHVEFYDEDAKKKIDGYVLGICSNPKVPSCRMYFIKSSKVYSDESPGYLVPFFNLKYYKEEK